MRYIIYNNMYLHLEKLGLILRHVYVQKSPSYNSLIFNAEQ